nr:MAG TPA: AAA ATPase [Bacteriophage sp.]
MFTKLELDDFRIFKNQTIHIGNTITAIAGQNATGKSTILGILGNACELKSKCGTTITDKQFKTEFSELFKGSKTFDKSSGNIGTIFYQRPSDLNEIAITLRVTWQKWTSASDENNRFRILPKWVDLSHSPKTTAKKLSVPSFYLGLSRLYPLGEDTAEVIEERKFKKKLTDADIRWLMSNYKHILSIDDSIISISNYEIFSKRSGGVNTDHYDFLSNSSGQDNLMQIMYLLLSFIKLHTEYEERGEEWPGGLLLIDEIDATLHPAAQIRLIDLIHDTCKRVEFQSIFTTHSLQILEYLNRMQVRNSDVAIEYFTTANNDLEIRHNPSFEAMENDMMIKNFYLTNNNRKLFIYSEDAEARWMIKKLLDKFNDHYRLIDIKLGGESLMELLFNDPDYFQNVLFILDGDKDLSGTKYKDLPDKYCNVLFLPGTEGPEALIYHYLITLPPTHEILSQNFDKGISLRAFKEMNPLTDSKYVSLTKTREKYKHWFKDNIKMLEDLNVMQYWCEDNAEELNNFQATFVNRFNILAARTKIPRIH